MNHGLTEDQHKWWRRIGFVSPTCPCPDDPHCDCSVAEAVWPDEAGYERVNEHGNVIDYGPQFGEEDVSPNDGSRP